MKRKKISDKELQELYEYSEDLKPSWSELDESLWQEGWNGLIRKALEAKEVYGEGSKEQKEVLQKMLDKKFENKMWVWEEMTALERMVKQQKTILLKLVDEVERTIKS